MVRELEAGDAMATPQSFAALLQQAEQLSADIEAGGALPRVQRNLQQVAEAGQRLLDRTSGARREDADVKASILLGARGYDVPKISQKLDSLSTAKSLEPIEPVWEADIEGFLRNERENTLLSVIEESRKNTFQEADRRCWDGMVREWGREKERILDSLLGPGQELDFPSEIAVLHSSPLSLRHRSSLNAVGMAYARAVFVRNEAAMQGLPHSLVTAFHQASTSFVDKSVTECWEMLKALVDLPHLPARAFEQRRSPSLHKAFATQARRYLERRFLSFIQDSVYRSLPQAKLGGVPGTYQAVRGYLTLRQAGTAEGLEDGSAGGQPVWAMVYYCLRCGDVPAAIHALGQSQSCAEFAVYLKSYNESEDQRLPPSSEAQLQMAYHRSVHLSQDPFKRAVHCLLARCALQDNHPDVCSKTDDYMWLKLCQMHFAIETTPPRTAGSGVDRLTLPQLQTKLLEEYGEGHFGAGRQPILYFQVLLLSAQFEAAVEFLSRVDALHTHAVHFALALHDLELLHVTDSAHSKMLVHEPVGVLRLNVARLVMNYGKRFALTDPREALQYYFLLRGMVGAGPGPEGHDLFSRCVAELVMESREFELLLGRVQPDGSRRAGAVDRFEADPAPLIRHIGAAAEGRGLFEDAVRLYDLAQDHEKVLVLLNRLLSRVVSAPPTSQSNRERLHALALSLAERYRTQTCSAAPLRLATFHQLLDVMQFFDHYHSKNIDKALAVMSALGLLPLQAGETVEQKVAAFRSCQEEVHHSLPDILLATMSILYTQHKQLSVSSPRVVVSSQDGGRTERQRQLRGLARALITFAGMLPYHMPGDANARLVQMEVLMA